jgi:hypothetical protein
MFAADPVRELNCERRGRRFHSAYRPFLLSISE